MLASRNIHLTLTDEARKQLFLAGYDRAYGARPLKRAIQRLIQDPLAMKILSGEVLHGDRVQLDADPLHNQLQFTVTERTPA
jgi:ATP-dependent Clp protease ATP-binding subunit ClpB